MNRPEDEFSSWDDLKFTLGGLAVLVFIFGFPVLLLLLILGVL